MASSPDHRRSTDGLSLRGITKSFGDTPVLRGIDLDVPDGTTLALLGPSGSGKSTVLRIVAGLETADDGEVILDGRDVTGVAAHRRDVGVVFQDQALFPHFDVADNVGFGLRMASVRDDERRRRVAEALELVGLPGYERRDPATLSGGEAQRVALARALAPRPAVVLLDEPLAALDQLLRERLLLELRALFDDLAVTVVTVTHDPAEAGTLGDRIAVLLEGTLAQVADAGEVLSRPVSARVAGLVGHRNVVEGEQRDGTVTCPWGRFPAPDGASGPVSVLVRPDALHADPAGSIEATVVGRVFRGGSAFAVVRPTAGPPLDVLAAPDWHVGDHVRLAVDADAPHVMEGTIAPGPTSG